MVEKNGKRIQFKEVLGQVNVIVNGVAVKGYSDYRTSAEWAQRQYGLSDGELMTLYYDYRETSGY